MSGKQIPKAKTTRSIRGLLYFVAIVLLSGLVACGGVSGPGGGSNDLTAYIKGLPSWQEVSPLQESNNGEPVGTISAPEEKLVGNQVYSCSVQTYSITKNPEQIVMMNPNASVIWPGALINGKSHLSAALNPLALDKSRRSPLGISVEGGGVLGVRAGVSTVIDQPVGSTVREGINQLIANAIESNVAVGAGYSKFDSVESYSATQATLALGLSGRYLGSSASAELNYERDVNEYTYTAYFIQRLFTISVDLPESPAAFFTANTTAQDLQAFGIGADNLPLYISSVSYGRILMYSFTSSEEREKIEAALEFSYNAPAGGVDGYAAAELEQTLQNAKIEILAIGGPNTGVANLIRDGNLESYFEAEIELNQVEPISFNIRNLANNSLAQVSNTTEYDVETCEAVGTVGGVMESTFDTDAEGWTTFGDADTANARWSDGSDVGFIGGYAWARDAANGSIWYFEAPDTYRGDKSAYYGAELHFHLRISATANATGPGIRLIGKNGTALYAYIPLPTSNRWTHYYLNFDETAGPSASNWMNQNTGQVATKAEIQAVLQDVGELRIRGEYVNGADWGAIDDVRLVPVSP